MTKVDTFQSILTWDVVVSRKHPSTGEARQGWYSSEFCQLCQTRMIIILLPAILNKADNHPSSASYVKQRSSLNNVSSQNGLKKVHIWLKINFSKKRISSLKIKRKRKKRNKEKWGTQRKNKDRNSHFPDHTTACTLKDILLTILLYTFCLVHFQYSATLVK